MALSEKHRRVLRDRMAQGLMQSRREGIALNREEAMRVAEEATTVYSIPDAFRSMTWAEWCRQYGYGLSHTAAAYVARRYGSESRWHHLTLGQMADCDGLVDRELGCTIHRYDLRRVRR